MKKKIDLAKQLIGSNPGLLACPVCGGRFPETDSYTLSCINRHTFDMSSSGYVNLLTRPVKSGYDADMLESRLKVIKSGFFDALLGETAGLIAANVPSDTTESFRMLDAGCGEGSQLAWLLGRLQGRLGRDCTGIGLDISKEGIRIAAREHPGILWLVADLARLPLADASLDAVVNILSPSNYSGFKKALRPGGLLVKAVPGSGYLKELRHAFFDDERQQYDSERVQRHFEECFSLVDRRDVQHTVIAGTEALKDLIRMTPLSWRVEQVKIDALLAAGEMEITVDFILLAGNTIREGMTAE